MAGLRPTKAFASTAIKLATVAIGKRFGRIYLDRYPDPLGYGKTGSRFCDPRKRADDKRFGVLYLGSSLKVCFVEAVLRARRNGAVGDYPIEEIELAQRKYAEIQIVAPLNLVDLRGDGPIRMGVPSDVSGPAGRRSRGLGRAPSTIIPRSPTGSSTLLGSTRKSISPSTIGRSRSCRPCVSRSF